MVNGFHQRSNVAEIIHYHVNGLLLMLYRSLVWIHLELILNSSKIFKIFSVLIEVIDFFHRRGAVRVDAYLNYLDINQCSMPHYVPNAFKGSDRCDYQSTVVCFSYYCCI